MTNIFTHSTKMACTVKKIYYKLYSHTHRTKIEWMACINRNAGGLQRLVS